MLKVLKHTKVLLPRRKTTTKEAPIKPLQPKPKPKSKPKSKSPSPSPSPSPSSSINSRKTGSIKNLRLSTLKSLALCVGCNTGGNKEELFRQITCVVGGAKVRSSYCSSSPSSSSALLGDEAERGKIRRVLSIDMGIRNMAICVCDVRRLVGYGSDGNIKPPFDLSVVAWKRVEVVAPQSSSAVAADIAEDESKAGRNAQVSRASSEKSDLFSPQSMAQTAYDLVENLLLPYAPDTILIERQRFRSAGAPAIQEWTVRVNMLEAMLWSIFTTMKWERSSRSTDGRGEQFPEIQSVSPQKVATFWTKLGGAGSEKAEKGKVDVKKKKIEVIRSWIKTWPNRSNEGSAHRKIFNLSFEEDAHLSRDAFLASTKHRRKTPRAAEAIKSPRSKAAASLKSSTTEYLQQDAPISVGKLDDLADCLLQATTSVIWEHNREEILPMILNDDVEGIQMWTQGKIEAKAESED